MSDASVTRPPRLGVLLPGPTPPPGLTDQTEAFDAVVAATPAAVLPPGIDWWVVLDEGVTLGPRFGAEVRAALEAAPGAEALYSDFIVAGPAAGTRAHVGGWSVERSRWQDYTGRVAVLPRSLMATLPQDLPTRVAGLRAATRVEYLPKPLYRVTDDDVPELPAPLRQRLDPGTLPYTAAGSAARPGRRLRAPASVSIVIPTRGGLGEVRGESCRLVDHCLGSLGSTLARPELDVDIVLVTDTDVDQSYATAWAQRLGDRLTVVPTRPPFNFSRKINAGVAAARGEFVCLLNDDIEPISPDWLADMVALAAEPDVGAVGALLLYEDGTVQHAGHVMGGGGVRLLDTGRRPESGPRARNACDRDVSGVTAACLVQRREVWEQLGGLDEAFPVSFNDVDYCERIAAAGLRVVQCNAARLYHFESKTRQAGAREWEVRLLRSRWHASLTGPDPFTPWHPDQAGARPPARGLRRRWDRVAEAFRAGGLAGVGRMLASAVRRRAVTGAQR